MSFAELLVALAEKMSLLAAAALVAVLFPPLRNRILGVGRRADKLAGLVLGVGLSVWGSILGIHAFGDNIDVRAIGIFIAAILGGRKAGITAGLVGGLYAAMHADAQSAPWIVMASVIDGLLAGLIANRWPRAFTGWRTFVTALGIQAVHLVALGVALLLVGHWHQYIPAWPAHVVKLLVNAAGLTLFVVVARLVVTREEAAVALVAARAAADAAALEALRRKLEPHFLFNALNALRATIRTDPARARELVADLADLYRYLLSHPEDAALRDEIAHAVAYLEIERARLGDERLVVRSEVGKDVGDVRVPALLLQPLVENAVKHGVSQRDGTGEVVLRARSEDGVLVVEVEDATQGERTADAASDGTGIALATLRERLTKRFGATATLTLETTTSGAIARVRLPLPSPALSPSSSPAHAEREAPIRALPKETT